MSYPDPKVADTAEPILEGEVPAPDYSAEGVDRTLIRWMLSLTPAQRLEVLQGFVDSVWALRHEHRT